MGYTLLEESTLDSLEQTARVSRPLEGNRGKAPQGPLKRKMTFSDFTIFYMTLGSPAGVLAFLIPSKHGLGKALTRAFFIWLGWPLAVLFIATRPLKRRAVFELLGEGNYRSRNSNARTARIRDLSTTATDALGTTGTFLFRETVDRYVALSEAVESASTDLNEIPAGDFFISAGSTAPEIGTLCLARKNRQKLTRHRSKARTDLIEAVMRIPSPDARTEARARLVLLFDSFGDPDGRKAVADRLAGDHDLLESPDMVGFKAA